MKRYALHVPLSERERRNIACRAGVYVIRSLDGRAQRVKGCKPPPDYRPPIPTEAERVAAKALLALKRGDR